MNTEKLLSNITLNHALEWQATKEKVCYICDTFDCYAYQEGFIKRIEAYLMHLLSFNEFDYLKHL